MTFIVSKSQQKIDFGICVQKEMLMQVNNKYKIAYARSVINFNVMKNYFYMNGKYGNINLITMSPETLGDWKWIEQEEWPGKCQDGKHQSPLSIDESKTVNMPNTRVRMEYEITSIPRIYFNGHEVIIESTFGLLYHQLEIGQRKFVSTHITIKFPSEHTIDEAQFGGEMLVHHKGNGVYFSFNEGFSSNIKLLLEDW